MVKYLFLGLVCAAIVFSPAAGFSQEEDTEYAYGSVVTVSKTSSEITISEYDWDKDEEAEVVYSIHPDATVEGSDSWKEIPNGSYVDIEYVTDEKGKKTAKHIAIYEPEPEEVE